MDPLFWILAGVVVGCMVGIVIIWRLEVQATRRAADTQRVEAEISARLKVFDPRAAVEEEDTRPVPTAFLPGIRRASRARPPAAASSPNLAEKIYPPSAQPSAPAARAPKEASAPSQTEMQPHPLPAARIEIDQPRPQLVTRAEINQPSPLPTARVERDQPPLPSVTGPAMEQPRPQPTASLVEQWGAIANGGVESPPAAEVLPSTPEAAQLRAAELGRERRYLEQAIEEQQTRLEQFIHHRTPGNSQEAAAIMLLQNELAEQRHHLEEIIFLEERYRQSAIPSLEQLAQDYKNTASPHTPRAFGVRRHSLAPLDPPGKNPPAPPAQAKTDSSL